MTDTKRQILERGGWLDGHSKIESTYPDDDPLRHLSCHRMALTVGLNLESHHQHEVPKHTQAQLSHSPHSVMLVLLVDWMTG